MMGVAKKGLSLIRRPIITGFNNLDELGGELRDYLLTREDNPFLQTIGKRMAKFGGVNLEESAGLSDRELEIAEEAMKMPPPTAAAVSEMISKTGLGDSDIAAQVYGRGSCPWTGRALTLLNEGKVDFDFIELDDSENTHLEGKLVAETSQATVPYVYLRGQFTGGFNELNEVVRLGELASRTMQK